MTTEADVQKYVDEIKVAADKEFDRLGYTGKLTPREYKFTMGKRFAKITEKSCGSTSVHCFVEVATGDIYKAAGWNAPAKGVRGNIGDTNKPYLCADFYRR